MFALSEVKLRRLEKSTPLPVVAVVTNMSYGYASMFSHCRLAPELIFGATGGRVKFVSAV